MEKNYNQMLQKVYEQEMEWLEKEYIPSLSPKMVLFESEKIAISMAFLDSVSSYLEDFTSEDWEGIMEANNTTYEEVETFFFHNHITTAVECFFCFNHIERYDPLNFASWEGAIETIFTAIHEIEK